jgi:hypothetical protein
MKHGKAMVEKNHARTAEPFSADKSVFVISPVTIQEMSEDFIVGKNQMKQSQGTTPLWIR